MQLIKKTKYNRNKGEENFEENLYFITMVKVPHEDTRIGKKTAWAGGKKEEFDLIEEGEAVVQNIG